MKERIAYWEGGRLDKQSRPQISPSTITTDLDLEQTLALKKITKFVSISATITRVK